jgi:heme-degrading monooxygenase HmoA
MHSRVTLLEVDTLRITIDDALDLFREQVLPGLREQAGYEGVIVLTNPDGKGMIVTVWDTEEEALAAAGFASAVLDEYVTLFRSPPGREQYEVVLAEMPELVALER